jgi:hypothetical protein
MLSAERQCTDLITYTSFSKEYIEDDVKNYLCNMRTIGKTLDLDKLDIKIEVKIPNQLNMILMTLKLFSINMITGLVPRLPKSLS